MSEQQTALEKSDQVESQEVRQNPAERGSAWLKQAGKNASETLAAHGLDKRALNIGMRVTGLAILGERLIASQSMEEKASMVGVALLSYGWGKVKKRLAEKVEEKLPGITNPKDTFSTHSLEGHVVSASGLSEQIRRGNYGN